MSVCPSLYFHDCVRVCARAYVRVYIYTVQSNGRSLGENFKIGYVWYTSEERN
jgi:hypothetical protein